MLTLTRCITSHTRMPWALFKKIMNVKAIQYELEHYPGFVSFEFKDIKDRIWTITEKLPVVGLPYPNDTSNIPFELKVPSKVLESYIDENECEVLKIQFLYNIETDNGVIEFEVFAKDYNG